MLLEIFLEYTLLITPALPARRADDAHGGDSQIIKSRILAICNWRMHVCLAGFPSRQLNLSPSFPQPTNTSLSPTCT